MSLSIESGVLNLTLYTVCRYWPRRMEAYVAEIIWYTQNIMKYFWLWYPIHVHMKKQWWSRFKIQLQRKNTDVIILPFLSKGIRNVCYGWWVPTEIFMPCRRKIKLEKSVFFLLNMVSIFWLLFDKDTTTG